MCMDGFLLQHLYTQIYLLLAVFLSDLSSYGWYFGYPFFWVGGEGQVSTVGGLTAASEL